MKWSVVRLRRLLTATGGSWGTEPEEGEVQSPCIRGADFDYGTLKINFERAPMRGYSTSEFAFRSARNGDLIVEKSGGGERQPVGRVVLNDAAEPVVPTNFAARLRPGRGIDSRFICYLMASLYAGGRTAAVIKQTTGIQNLDLEAFLDTQVKLPVEACQRSIADFLDAETARIDALTAKKKRLQTVLDERATGLAAKWVGDLTSRYGSAPLRRWVTRFEQGWSPICDNLPASAAEWGVLKTSAVSSGAFDPNENKRLPSDLEPNHRWAVHDGDLLMTRGSGSATSVGRAAVVRTDHRKLMISDLLYRLHLARMNTDFVAMVLRSPQLRQQIEGSIRSDLGQTLKLRSDDILSLMIPAVPYEGQARSLVSLNKQITGYAQIRSACVRQIDLLCEHRQALITAAVTGELEIPGVVA
jgi:type I restriction enzyme, S subunit